MAQLFEPFIESPKDYAAIRRLINTNLPDSFDDWTDLQFQKAAELVKAGHRITKIKVDPDEFARYLNATGDEHTLDALRRYVVDIRGGKKRY